MKRLFVFCLTIFAVVLTGLITASQSVAKAPEVVISDSTYTLTGTVVNAETNDLISEATVAIDETKISTTTDNTGSFTFEGLTQGSYTLKISAEGYEDTQVKVNVGDDTRTVIIKLPTQKNRRQQIAIAD